MNRVRGRYAPSPTARMHLGNASTALLAWLSARSQVGAYVLRLEDLDGPRVRSGAADGILEDLTWLGIDWDEGYDVGGPHAPYAQSARGGFYDRAFDRLRAAGSVYPCFCSRRDIQAAASAPQVPGDELPYPGTCGRLGPEEAGRCLEAGAPASWRFRVPHDAADAFEDIARGSWLGERPTDFVVRRADGTAAYQLAVVVDDAAMGITEVVRGDDLLHSTLRQLALYRALDHPPPRFAHVPLLLGEDGVRLSKRHAGTSIARRREAGASAEAVVGSLALTLGLRDDDRPVAARDLVAGFRLDAVPSRPDGIRIDETSRKGDSGNR